MKKIKLRRRTGRVDVQVSILSLLVTIFCTICAYLLVYHLTYQDMLTALNERVHAIHDFLEVNLDKDIYWDINNRDDMEKASYTEMKELLENIKQATDVQYLYTAQKNQDGDFVYLIDGLPLEAEDFRYPGDKIEPEIYEDMERALGGETVLPDEIKNTDWGKIFITYFPIHDGEKVVGVLGIEIEAEHQYDTYQRMKFVIPCIIFVTGILATAASVVFFRRISNPSYQDMANTDHLTGLKNRNAFETDIHNLEGKKGRCELTVLVADLNGLKEVNDRLGHGTGDQYISAAGQSIRNAVPKEFGVYRLGGDEYTVLLEDVSEQEIQKIISGIEENLASAGSKISKYLPLSISIGCASYDQTAEESISDQFRRADANMYEKKREFHKRNLCRDIGPEKGSVPK